MALSLDKAHTVVLAMDYLNDIVHPEGKFAGWGMPAEAARRNVLANAKRLIETARGAGVPVVHVRVALRPGLAGVPLNAPIWQGAAGAQALIDGTWGAEIHDDVKPLPGEVVVTKRRISAVYNTDLLSVLAGYNAKTLVLGGVSTNFVVEGTARDASDLGYEVIIAEDCCSAGNEEHHQAALGSLGMLATISSSGEVAAAFK